MVNKSWQTQKLVTRGHSPPFATQDELMFSKILIANRGEIACRVIKTARRMGVQTVAVYSDADQHAMHVKLADEAVHIGAAPSSESYLRGDNIIHAAKQTGAQAIHPGYGFLSENADFCRRCDEHGLVFIGPPVAAIEAMGSKSEAKTIMGQAEVPLVPGYHGKDQSAEVLKAAADKMGYPVLLKAVAGGGGKGMRQVWQASEFSDALAAAKREAQASFGNTDMLVEKYLTKPRHVEVQVFCDRHGNGVYLFERDCSVQRRHQKVIEEAPAPNLGVGLREQMGVAALRAAQAIDYVGAGTVEFLLDADGSFYFMEMNTRLQVEHPVTEMITGQDLVEWQLRVAAGERLPLEQQDLSINGHAFEARVYAEDPNNNFLPVTGQLKFLQPPTESARIRVDTGVEQGDSVSVYYDPMIAKLVVWGETREQALALLVGALRDYRICGTTTNIEFLINLASHRAFSDCELDTGFIDKHAEELFTDRAELQPEEVAIAALYLLKRKEKTGLSLHRSSDANSPWNQVDHWRTNLPGSVEMTLQSSDAQYKVKVSYRDTDFDITINQMESAEQSQLSGHAELHDNMLSATVNGHRQTLSVYSELNEHTLFAQRGRIEVMEVLPDIGQAGGQDQGAGFVAPMNGTIVDVLVSSDQKVQAGDTLIIIEAMKMEHTIKAPTDGIVTNVFFKQGDLVDGGAVLLGFDAAD